MKARLLSAILLSITASIAAPRESYASTGNMESVLNAFIASIAKTDATFKTSIERYIEGMPIPAGFQRGESAMMGSYIFRPKSWAELTDQEKLTIRKHPQMKAFLASMRNTNIYPSLPYATTKVERNEFPVEGGETTPAERTIRIDPEEMLRNRPVVINVP